MTKRVINQVRDYMTIVTEDRVYQICPVEMLLRQQTPEAVVGFLELLRAEYKKELGEILKDNKTHPKINHLVVLNFRLKMAINTIRNAKTGDGRNLLKLEEVKRGQGNEAEQRAAESSGLS
jgi:hypothetical protein